MAAARPQQIQLVVGLGNPGPEYENTPHNAGFRTLDLLAEEGRLNYWKNLNNCMLGTAKLDDREILLLKPLSFMNLSGGPVAGVCKSYDISPDEILVIHDEMDIPQGDVRVKFGGGHGGHNGLKSIFEKLGTRDFSRIRVGIGRPEGKMDAAAHVLRQLKGELGERFNISIEDAAKAAVFCIKEGVLKARDSLNGLHRTKLDETP